MSTGFLCCIFFCICRYASEPVKFGPQMSAAACKSSALFIL
jgi:hypothetical protein